MSGPPPNAVTERLIIPVNGGVDDWKEQLKTFLLTLKKQPGYLRTRWGPWEENMQKLDLIIGWESPDAVAAFRQSEDFANAMSQMKQASSGDYEFYYLKFKPLAPKEAVDSPIAEVITITHCTGDEDQLRAHVEKVKALPGCNGMASGFSTTEVAGSGRVFVAAIGWANLEASRAADKSIYTPTGAGDVERHHCNFRFPIKGFSVTN
ncbi:hypothetical protein GQ53DRAFT_855345 [Thozetella sp. PMI_491]|nr:hypothetical protein GQ53DRAFT_855345 [Thozetella sp. PMI_491]